MEKKQRHKAITFTLKGIDPRALEERYGVTISSNIGNSNVPKFTTPIDGLVLNNSENKLFSYMDESKKSHRCVCTMVNTTHSKLPLKTSNCCYWCRNQFSSVPIGVPLQYVYSQSVKEYYSEITKDTYTIRENISVLKRQQLEHDIENKKFDENVNISVSKNEYYITDGLFCSFNCAYAFIQDNESNQEYHLSRSLLTKMYEELYNTEFNILPAPHWRLLQQYGGHLTIDDFRDQFNKIEYIDINNRITDLPIFTNSSKLYEQKIKF